MTTDIHITTKANGIVIATLSRPEKLNSLSTGLHAEFRRLLDLLISEEECHALVITGAGKAFCAGQDLNERAVPEGQAPINIGEKLDKDLIPLVRRLRTAPFPVIAAVNGIAAGAGVSLALSADIALAGRSATFSFSFVRVGLGADGGLSWTLPRLVGQARASALLLLGQTVSAQDAEKLGLIAQCVDDENLLPQAVMIAESLAAGPRDAIAEIRKSLRASHSSDYETQLMLERDAQQRLGLGSDYRARVRAFFERRSATFGGQKR